MTKKAILFDFDGVVVKSMEQHFEAWRRAFAEKGIEMKAEEFFILEGQGIRTIALQVGKNHGLDETTVNEVMERKVNYYNQFMTLEFYEHFHEMIEHLFKNKIPMAIVTGGNSDRVRGVIREHFNHYFSAIVTIEDVERGKPFPDPFLKAAKLLDVEPESCVVVENAPMGITAAKRAGMTVIAVTTTLTPHHLKEADFIARDFFEVENILQKLFNIK
ncbi:MAG: HAD family phosphatase [Calditrichaeota bacterium]|nr:HAD family phosphatase [Calditrichota bacterium]